MYNHILVPTDGSEVASEAVDYAIDLASHFDATIHALYSVEPENTTLPSEAMRHQEVHDEYVEWGEETTNEVVAQADARGIDGVSVVTDGQPHEQIAEYASANDIDLIVMGTAGRAGWSERLLGSVTEKTVRTADVPVLIVDGQRHP